MQLKESISKTKFFFHKSIKSLKSIFYVRYEKLPKAPSCNPLVFCAGGSMKKNQMDQYYAEFCNEWECDLEMARKRKRTTTSLAVTEETVRGEKDGCDESSVMHRIMSPVKKKEDGSKMQKTKKSSHPRKVEQCSKKQSDGDYALAKKMKELEMMDVGDVEHVLDVEEALHYYSRLKSPVYLDMVDKFFTDMYRDFSVPQASASINSSKRRLNSIRF